MSTCGLSIKLVSRLSHRHQPAQLFCDLYYSWNSQLTRPELLPQ
jgi:hypothetical protein